MKFLSKLKGKGKSTNSDASGAPPPYEFDVSGQGSSNGDKKPAPSGSDDDSEKPPPYTYSAPVQWGVTDGQLAILSKCDTVIIVDNSGSMGPSWNLVCDAVSKLAAVASGYDGDGIDIHFLNGDNADVTELKSQQHVANLFKQFEPKTRSPSPLGDRLDGIARGRLRRPGTSKKVNYIIITDGVPTDDPGEVIVALAELVKQGKLGNFGIQFIQIGNDEGATAFLTNLDNNLKQEHGIEDMVDTTKYHDVQDPTSSFAEFLIKKCLLGGIDRKMDEAVFPTQAEGSASQNPFASNSGSSYPRDDKTWPPV